MLKIVTDDGDRDDRAGTLDDDFGVFADWSRHEFRSVPGQQGHDLLAFVRSLLNVDRRCEALRLRDPFQGVSVILVTGGSGFVGYATLATLSSDVLTPSSSDLDLTDHSAVADFFAEHRPEVVVHLAARVGGITANLAKPADFLLDNIRMDGNVLSAAAMYPPAHLVLMLSTCMYPDRLSDAEYPMRERQTEDGPPPPTNAAYAAAKRTLLHGALAVSDQYNVPFTAFIPSNLYGPGDHYGTKSSHFLAAAITKIEGARVAGQTEVEFFGTGVALRQFLLVSDLADLIATVLENGPLNTAVNVAPSHNLSIREFAEAVAQAAGFEGEVAFSGVGPDGQYRKDVSTRRLVGLIPEWTAIETSLEEGLAITIDWYREHVAAG